MNPTHATAGADDRLPGRVAASAAAVAAALLYAFSNRGGLSLSPDGWALWQGAVSMLEGRGYAYFSGTRIVAWPPAYSAIVAASSYLLGNAAWALLAANAILVLASVYGWVRFAGTVASATGRTPGLPLATAMICFIVAYVCLYAATSASLLSYAVLPFLLRSLWQVTQHPGGPPARLAIMGALMLALLMSHNLSVVFVPGVLVLVMVFGGSLAARVRQAVVVVVLPMLCWVLLRWQFGQLGSHPITGTNKALATTVNDLVWGCFLGFFPLPEFAALVCVVIGVIGGGVLQRLGRLEIVTFVAVFAGLALATSLVLFSIVYVNGSLLEHRFTHYLPLLVMPLLYAGVADRRLLSTALVLLTVPILWFQLYQANVLPRPGAIPLAASLSHLPRQGNSGPFEPQLVVSGTQVLVGPIAWEEPLHGYRADGSPLWGAGQLPQ